MSVSRLDREIFALHERKNIELRECRMLNWETGRLPPKGAISQEIQWKPSACQNGNAAL
jgi:hypothetical protein